MCPDGTQCRQGSPDAPDARRCGVLVQDAQDAQDAGSRLGESGRNTTGSDAGHLFADVKHRDLTILGFSRLLLSLQLIPYEINAHLVIFQLPFMLFVYSNNSLVKE